MRSMASKRAWYILLWIGIAVLMAGLLIQSARLAKALKTTNDIRESNLTPDTPFVRETAQICPEWASDAPLDSGDAEPEVIDTSAKDALAKMVWGEARGCSKAQQAACVWVVLNRVDDPRWPGSILGVLTQAGQFAGYDPANPVEPEIRALVDDVIARWGMEPMCIGSVGRVIPDDYFYWQGTGTVNVFRKEYRSTELWGWELEDPYDE